MVSFKQKLLIPKKSLCITAMSVVVTKLKKNTSQKLLLDHKASFSECWLSEPLLINVFNPGGNSTVHNT